jgi:hypothetical protein
MVFFILRMVEFKLFCRLLEARQNLRLSPSKILVPIGSLCLVQRLWNVKFFG